MADEVEGQSVDPQEPFTIPEESGDVTQAQEAPEAPETPSDDFTRESFDGYKEGFHKKSREYAEYRARMKPAEDLVDFINRNPGFKSHINNYFERSQEDSGVEFEDAPTYRHQAPPRAVQNVMDQDRAALQSIQNDLFSMKLDQNLQAIRSSGHPLDSKMEADLLEEAYKRGTVEVEGLYWQLYGPKLLDMAKKNAGDKVKAKIQSNRNAYAGSIPGSAQTSEVDISKLQGADYNKAVMDGIIEEMSR